MNRTFNVIKSDRDVRDYDATVLATEPVVLLDYFMLDKKGLKVYDQGKSDMCTAYGGTGLLSYHFYKEHNRYVRFSPQFLYGQRFDDGDNTDRGYMARMLYSDMRKYGCVEYGVINPALTSVKDCMQAVKALPDDILEQAKTNRLESFFKVFNPSHTKIIELLHTYRVPVGIAWLIGDRVDKEPILKSSYDGYLGGHFSLIVGYKRIKDNYYFIVLNSWGTGYGDEGYYYLPFTAKYIIDVWIGLDYRPHVIKMQIGSKTYSLNGGIRAMDTEPVIYHNRTYVPLRFVAEALGYEVRWNPTSRAASLKKAKEEYLFYLDRAGQFTDLFSLTDIKYGDSGRTKHYLDKNDRIMVPARKVFEYLGYRVEWDGVNQKVIIKN